MRLPAPCQLGLVAAICLWTALAGRPAAADPSRADPPPPEAPSARLGVAELPEPDLSGAEPRVAAKLRALLLAAASRPDSAHAWGHLAMNLDVHGFEAEARGCYARAAALDPADLRWPYYEAVLLAELGEPGARARFRAATEIRSDYAPLWVRYGDELAAWGELDAAHAAYERAAESRRDLLHAYLGLARVALARNRPETARDHALKAAEIDPESSEARGLLAESSRRLGRLEDARRQAELARALPAVRPLDDPLYAALAAEGVSSFWHRRRGRALLESGRLEEAEAELRAALAGSPQAEIHNDLGLALGRLGRTAEAVAEHRAAIALRGDFPEAHQLLGLALAELGDLDGAVGELERAVALRPGLPGAALNLGTLYQRAGRRAEAIAVFRGATERAPDDPRLLARLAWLLATAPETGLRDGEEAVAMAERALELLPVELPEALDVLAAALAEAGRFDRAVETAARARELAWSGSRPELAGPIGERLALYEAGRPFRERTPVP